MDFDSRKARVIAELASSEKDKSKKGGLDAPIADLVACINSHPCYFTTSSCSGRVSLFAECAISGQPRAKKGGNWLFVSHEAADGAAILSTAEGGVRSGGLATFRFEPFILAVECSSLEAGAAFVSCAIGAGFRESGITSCSKRVIVAVRSSIRLEVPVADKGAWLVTPDYLHYLTASANAKLQLNYERTQRFLQAFTDQLLVPNKVQKIPLEDARANCLGVGWDKEVSSADYDKLRTRQIEIIKRIGQVQKRLRDTERLQSSSRASSSQSGEAFSEKVLPAQEFLVKGVPLVRLQRWGHTAVAEGGRLLLFGGGGGGAANGRLNDLLSIEPESGEVSEVKQSNPPPVRMGHTASLVGGNLLILGGRGGPSSPLSDAHLFDPVTKTWKSLPPLDQPRFRHAAAVVREKVYVFGGISEGEEVLGGVLLVSGVSGGYEVLATGGEPSPRHSHSMAALGNKVFLYGGCDSHSRALGDLHILDLSSLTWQQVPLLGPTPPPPRFSHSLLPLGSTHLLLLGGCPRGPPAANAAWLLDITTMTWQQIYLDLPPQALLVRHTATLVGTRLFLIGGGAAVYAFGSSFNPPYVVDLSSVYRGTSPGGLGTSCGSSRSLENRVSPRGLKTGVPPPRRLGLGCSPSPHKSPRVPEPRTSSETRLSSQNPEGTVGWVLVVDKAAGKRCKDALKEKGWLDLGRQVAPLDGGAKLAFPLTAAAVAEGGVLGAEMRQLETQKSTRGIHSPHVLLRESVAAALTQQGLPQHLLEELPTKWEKLGDLAILPAGSLQSPKWGPPLYQIVASAVSAKRLARQAPVANNACRESQVQLLLGDNGWVEHRENGITYCLDATRCMFSSGNVTEKQRVAKLPCQGETVVDLFAGIGYYTLPYLVKAGAAFVYACEWNPHALQALRHNLAVNGVAEKCQVLEGDNRLTAPTGVAHRVNLGLIPSSEASWPVAVQALRPEGGVLHVHGNALDTEEQTWAEHVRRSVEQLAATVGREWSVELLHMERVKWYAPHIRHLVVDIRCTLKTQETAYCVLERVAYK